MNASTQNNNNTLRLVNREFRGHDKFKIDFLTHSILIFGLKFMITVLSRHFQSA